MNPTAHDNPPPPFWARVVATGAGAGYVPWAPGTAGTLAGLLIALIPGVTEPLTLSVLIVIGVFVGAAASGRVAESVGHQLSRSAGILKERFQPGGHAAPDPSIVVIDEIVGIWITLLFLPPSIPSYIVAFVVFRSLDILKPPPARQLERLPGGWGIMLDDVVAGMYANLLSQLFVRIFLSSHFFLGALVSLW